METNDTRETASFARKIADRIEDILDADNEAAWRDGYCAGLREWKGNKPDDVQTAAGKFVAGPRVDFSLKTGQVEVTIPTPPPPAITAAQVRARIDELRAREQAKRYDVCGMVRFTVEDTKIGDAVYNGGRSGDGLTIDDSDGVFVGYIIDFNDDGTANISLGRERSVPPLDPSVKRVAKALELEYAKGAEYEAGGYCHPLSDDSWREYVKKAESLVADIIDDGRQVHDHMHTLNRTIGSLCWLDGLTDEQWNMLWREITPWLLREARVRKETLAFDRDVPRTTLEQWAKDMEAVPPGGLAIRVPFSCHPSPGDTVYTMPEGGFSTIWGGEEVGHIHSVNDDRTATVVLDTGPQPEQQPQTETEQMRTVADVSSALWSLIGHGKPVKETDHNMFEVLFDAIVHGVKR